MLVRRVTHQAMDRVAPVVGYAALIELGQPATAACG
jgi:hypothetical protein